MIQGVALETEKMRGFQRKRGEFCSHSGVEGSFSKQVTPPVTGEYERGAKMEPNQEPLRGSHLTDKSG